mmetsp:Transcript_81023/g.142861  ORF Transcript_81023/g.142861 Transcript_81023/m.142861 type:complete len:271 (-) Transcript_81023:8-820(-)
MATHLIFFQHNLCSGLFSNSLQCGALLADDHASSLFSDEQVDFCLRTLMVSLDQLGPDFLLCCSHLARHPYHDDLALTAAVPGRHGNLAAGVRSYLLHLITTLAKHSPCQRIRHKHVNLQLLRISAGRLHVACEASRCRVVAVERQGSLHDRPGSLGGSKCHCHGLHYSRRFPFQGHLPLLLLRRSSGIHCLLLDGDANSGGLTNLLQMFTALPNHTASLRLRKKTRHREVGFGEGLLENLLDGKHGFLGAPDDFDMSNLRSRSIVLVNL